MFINRQPLQFYVNKLAKKEPFSLARYGDGEWLCMFGKAGGNSNGCAYTPALREDLMESLHNQSWTFYHGIQRILPSQLKDVEKFLWWHKLEYRWYDSEIFADSLIEGGLFPLIEQLRKMDVVVIGNETLKNVPFEYKKFIEIPKANAHAERARVLAEVKDYGKPAVYLFSAGMAANVFVSELHNTIAYSWFIDIGHIWDIFCGVRSRDYLLDINQETINKNLGIYAETT